MDNLQGNNSSVDEAENQINDLEHKEEKKTEQEEKRIQKNEDSIRSLWDNFKRSNIHIIGVPEREVKGHKQSVRYRVPNTGYKDAQGT